MKVKVKIQSLLAFFLKFATYIIKLPVFRLNLKSYFLQSIINIIFLNHFPFVSLHFFPESCSGQLKLSQLNIVLNIINTYKYIMNNNLNDSQEEENIDLQDSEGMNADQKEMFLNISRSKSADSFIGKFLPHLNEVPDRDRSLVWDPLHSLTHNIILSQLQPTQVDKGAPTVEQPSGGLKIFKKIKKEKVKSKCDYDKNICGYITKKVIREFVGRNYQQEVEELTRKYRCSFAQCKSYYLRKVEYVTGPSHLPQLFKKQPDEAASLGHCKRAFREFYRWFLKERYLRYLLLEGKMTNKLAYIEYKNTHLFKFVNEQDQDEQLQEEIRDIQMHMRTRSKSGLKMQESQLT